LAPPRVAESVLLGLTDGIPAATSPYAYIAGSVGSRERADVAPLAILVEPGAAWRGTATHAARLVETLVGAIAEMRASNVPAQLHTLIDLLNTAERQRSGERPGRGARRPPSGFGVACLVLAGADLYIAQLPPGQLLMRQAGRLYAFPPAHDDPDEAAALYAPEPAPLGRDAVTTPRLLHTRVAAGDVILLATSAMLRCAPRSVRDLSLAPLDALLTDMGAAADRAGVRDGVVSIMRLA
jgi:hypothetical protein